TSPPNSCRSSETIEKAGSSSRRVCARSSISAGVTSRPAKTPKLTRTSRAGSSCSRTQKAIAGSIGSGNLPFPRLPPELRCGDHEPGCAPGREDAEGARLRPDRLAPQIGGVDDVEEVLQRQRVAHRPEE